MPVATVELQDHGMDAIEAMRDRVQRAVAQGDFILGIRLCVSLLRLRRGLDSMGRVVSATAVDTEGDRMFLRAVARHNQLVAAKLSSDRDQLAEMRPFPILRFMLVRLLDAAVIKAEDIAETAALGASLEFANLVEEDLKGRAAAHDDG